AGMAADRAEGLLSRRGARDRGVRARLRWGLGRDQHPPCGGGGRPAGGELQRPALRARGDGAAAGRRRPGRPRAALRPGPRGRRLSGRPRAPRRGPRPARESRRCRATRPGRPRPPAARPHLDAPDACLPPRPTRNRKLNRMTDVTTRSPVLDALLTRRSVGALAAPAPSADQLETILRAATTAPDPGGLRPDRFVAIDAPRHPRC